MLGSCVYSAGEKVSFKALARLLLTIQSLQRRTSRPRSARAQRLARLYWSTNSLLLLILVSSVAKFVVRALSRIARGLGKGIYRGFQEAVRKVRALENSLLLLILVSSVAKVCGARRMALKHKSATICMLSSCLAS